MAAPAIHANTHTTMPNSTAYVLAPGLWATHLQHGTAIASLTDIDYLKAIIADGAEEYIRLSAAHEGEKERADYLQAQVDQMATTTNPEPKNTWTPKPPRYSDMCPYRTTRRRCRRNQCGYVHEDQVEMYKEVIERLAWATKEEERQAGGEAMEL